MLKRTALALSFVTTVLFAISTDAASACPAQMHLVYKDHKLVCVYYTSCPRGWHGAPPKCFPNT
jgi:hypothetical protein